jgi:hypothetical protein
MDTRRPTLVGLTALALILGGSGTAFGDTPGHAVPTSNNGGNGGSGGNANSNCAGGISIVYGNGGTNSQCKATGGAPGAGGGSGGSAGTPGKSNGVPAPCVYPRYTIFGTCFG